MKDCILRERPNAGAGEWREEKGVAETKLYELTATPPPVPCTPAALGGKLVEECGTKG